VPALSGDRFAHRCGWRSTCTTGALVLAAAAPGADAELIELCDRPVAIAGEIATLMATQETIEDETRTQPQFAALLAAQHRVFDQIFDQPEVTL
jgi:hypothetical protein